jgi:N-acetylmuramoyl-L-alanine amidase
MKLLPPIDWRPLLTLKMSGDDVYSWQVLLLAAGLYLGASGADGDFGKLTANATVAWQRPRGIPLAELGSVGRWTREAILDGEPPSPTMRMPQWPHLPYVEAANWSRHLPAQRKDLIVIHSIECAEASTAAENTAAWFAGKRGESPRSSAHACIDDDTIVQCVPWDRIAWHAPGANARGIGLEHAGWARQTPAQWRDGYSQRMLRRSAWLVARLRERLDTFPIEFVDETGLLKGAPGITTHDRISRAFRKSTHTDPGAGFPMDQYLELARAA